MWRGIGFPGKKVYVGECAGSCSVGRPWKGCIDTVKDCLRKRGLDFRKAWRMVQERCEWWEFVRGSSLGGGGDEPLTLMRCHSCGLSQLCEAIEGWNKGEIFCFSFLSLALFLF